jgi:hypothetical protein
MLGRSTFTGREYRKPGEGITITSQGVVYKDFVRVAPPWMEHILSQFPQYNLIKKLLVPAREWDDGTILNPNPIINPITGEYKYPIKGWEKVLNMLGVDLKTVQKVRESYENYMKRKHGNLSAYYKAHGEGATIEDLERVLENIQNNEALWHQIQEQIEATEEYRAKKRQELMKNIEGTE